MKGNDDGSYESAPGPGKSTNNVYDYNVYYGFPAADDPHAIQADPMLVNPGKAGTARSGLEGYALKQHSPAIDSGKLIDNNGGKADRGAIESSICPQH